MAHAGYPGIETPYLVREVLGLGDDPGGPEAVAAAVRDVACKRKVNLVGVGAAVETACQERVAAEVPADLAAYRVQRAAPAGPRRHPPVTPGACHPAARPAHGETVAAGGVQRRARDGAPGRPCSSLRCSGTA